MLTKEELPEMYHKRWKIETACRNLKNHECIENFSGKKRITILQDIFAGVYLYNLVTALEGDAEEERNWEVKASLKTNMNTTMGMVKKYFFQFILETNP